jgi:hypothetical protein
MTFDVQVEKTLYALVVTVNGLPHLQVVHKGYRGMQSFVDGLVPPDVKWVIEFYYKGMDPIVVEYNSADKWVAVLTALSPFLK